MADESNDDEGGSMWVAIIGLIISLIAKFCTKKDESKDANADAATATDTDTSGIWSVCKDIGASLGDMFKDKDGNVDPTKVYTGAVGVTALFDKDAAQSAVNRVNGALATSAGAATGLFVSPIKGIASALGLSEGVTKWLLIGGACLLAWWMFFAGNNEEDEQIDAEAAAY